MTEPMKRVILFTGAGTSVASGIPTFRVDTDGKTAFWNDINPMEVSDIYTFRDNRELSCEFHNYFRTMISHSQPNSFHYKIKQWQDDLREHGTQLIVITQNVDDLLERVGVVNVRHIHGDIRYMQCLGRNHTFYIGYENQDVDRKCAECNCKKCKPGVVFFNENAPLYPETYKLLHSLSSRDALIVIGTSCTVFPIKSVVQKEKPLKVFSALTFPVTLDQKYFDKMFLGKCTDVIQNIIDYVNPENLKINS